MPPADDSVSLVAESDWVRVPSREQTITHYICLSILQCGLSGNEDWSELPQAMKTDQNCLWQWRLIRTASGNEDWSELPLAMKTDQNCLWQWRLIRTASGNEDWSELPQARKTDQNCLRQGRRQEPQDWGHHERSPWEPWREVLQKLIPFFFYAVLDEDEDINLQCYGGPFRFETTWQGYRPCLQSLSSC